jgi:crotonobetainyl-CoA:carnitine CoA-transferase CaiB-like acyl-CoA transferase
LHTDLPLADIKVVDCSTVVAGPQCTKYLADFGADVIKVERPGGDPVRSQGWRDPRDGVTLWWKYLNRGKRLITIDLKTDEGRAQLLDLCADADVLVENFRPGTMERLGVGPEQLHARNPKLVITRVTGFGQDGPYARRPGFATLAEAMSGFAAINGEPDGGPILPPIALADEVTGLVAAFSTMVAVHSGVGQVVDVNLLESMFQIMGPLAAAWRLLGFDQPRLGSGIPYSVPRGTYQTADGQWVAISTSTDSVGVRVMELVGLGDDPELATSEGRVARRGEVDDHVRAWIAARPAAEVLDAFTQADAAIAPVMTMAQLLDDPHVIARQLFIDVDGDPMQNVVARLSATPGRIRWPGREEGPT